MHYFSILNNTFTILYHFSIINLTNYNFLSSWRKPRLPYTWLPRVEKTNISWLFTAQKTFLLTKRLTRWKEANLPSFRAQFLLTIIHCKIVVVNDIQNQQQPYMKISWLFPDLEKKEETIRVLPTTLHIQLTSNDRLYKTGIYMSYLIISSRRKVKKI